MESVASKRGLFNYFKLIVVFFALLLLGLLMAYSFLDKNSNNPKEYFNLLLGAALVFYAFFNVYGYFKHTPKIVIDRKIFRVANTSYRLEDIRSLKLTGKNGHTYLTLASKEAAEIIFEDGYVVYINDSLYANSSQLKVFLEDVYNRKNDGITEQVLIKEPLLEKRVSSNKQSIDYKYYKGLYIFSTPGLVTIVCATIIIVQLLMANSDAALYIFFAIFLLFFQLIFISRFYYFLANDNFLIVKSSFLFWKRHTYPLSTIKEVVFELSSKKTNGLRIITTDYTTRIYLAGSLQKRHWKALKLHLEQHNIPVRNELYFNI
ncbi:hypothetical protein [Flavobacterium subsaxonicum]|nr:hypothetical protein [Flavobacterium subsaxonicum]